MPDKKNEDGGAILTPEDFDSTRNTELAACLITLGFPLLNNTPGDRKSTRLNSSHRL